MKSTLLNLAVLGAFMGGLPPMAYTAPQVQVSQSKRQRRGLFNGMSYWSGVPYGRKGAGISMAQQKRTAKKARNVKRHKAACQG